MSLKTPNMLLEAFSLAVGRAEKEEPNPAQLHGW